MSPKNPEQKPSVSPKKSEDKPAVSPKKSGGSSSSGSGATPRGGEGQDRGGSGGFVAAGGQGSGGTSYTAAGNDYLRRGSTSMSAQGYLGRQNRTAQGPIFQPRTGGQILQKGNNNRVGTAGPPVLFNRIPQPNNRTGGRGSLGHQVQRMEDYRNGELRRGYWHYDNSWMDRYFGYGFYFFNPDPFRCVFSPYYFYWSVPGYFDISRCWYSRPLVIVIIGSPLNWGYYGRGLMYNMHYNVGNNRQYSQAPVFDRALSDLTDAFRYSDARALDRFLPRDGSVEIYIDGEYSYTMSANDYYDVTADLIYSVNTTGFEIVQVRKTDGGHYYVVARHDYLDVSGYRQTNWLTFTLQYDGAYYRIVQAGTSRVQPY